MHIQTEKDWVYTGVYMKWLNESSDQNVILKEFASKDGMKIYMLKVPKHARTKENLEDVHFLFDDFHCYTEITGKEVERLKAKHKVILE